MIHTGPDSKSAPGVLVEVKKPGNKTEMVRPDNLKAKAFYELILYYLRERITNANLEIKHLIATNVFEWYIFDAALFEKTFAQNKSLVRQFNDFEQGRLAGTTTDFFYNSIAEPFVSGTETDFYFTWFDFREYKKPLLNEDKSDDANLIALFKALSPEHLLKLPFLNDSNTLDKTFYSELLHIIGLTETKSGSKKIIERKNDGQRDPGSLLENTILQLDTRDKITRLTKPILFGETYAERLYNVSLELVITWLNRILFLKLLEAQLIRYHKGDPEYGFMKTGRIDGYDDLDNLFFRVLARKTDERDPEMTKLFSTIPYLNSSLFEPTELEQLTIFISNLQDHAPLPIISSTVLKDNNGKKRTGKLSGLQYLFEFLNAYDFAGEGSEEIQEDNKTLINASVLGLIFEKINGYKDGSFFTPGFITMYMCRETIRRAVVQKFNEAKGWSCESIDQLYDKIEDRQEANEVINSLKICDPAVGSGHFLVSALNEMIAIKSDLKILSDRDGRRMKEYRVEVANDELIITDEEGDLFEYLPGNNESQRIQEAMFHEKQTIIENCLFGVDINPNSVKICRLRLWIELLKSAYYKAGSNYSELETLPNIDINIKCGNSLMSRYSLDADIRQALKKSKWSIDSYRLAVMSYRNATSKEEKRTMERLIESIKSDFETEVAANDKRLLHLKKLNGDLFNLTQQTSLFDRTKKEVAEWNKQVNELTGRIKKVETELEEIKNNKIYENAFEWRFEFPEVLNDEGEFVGFDAVIGNPPYGSLIQDDGKKYFIENFFCVQGPFEIYKFFIEKSVLLLADKGLLCFITPDTWTNLSYFIKLRELLLTKFTILICSQTLYKVFEEATVNNTILLVQNFEGKSTSFNLIDNTLSVIGKGVIEISENDFYLQLKPKPKIIETIELGSIPLDDFIEVWRGMSAYGAVNKERPYNSFTKETEFHRPLLNGGDIGKYAIRWSGEYIKYGKWLHRPRPAYIYDSQHLLVQRIRNPKLFERIIATFDSDKFISSDGLSNILLKKHISEQDALKFILGLLNSRMINYWFSFYFFDVNIKPEQIRRIPVKGFDNHTEKDKIISIVDQILNLKQSNFNADTLVLEKEIDNLVYELYGLTEEEIKIVEQEVFK